MVFRGLFFLFLVYTINSPHAAGGSPVQTKEDRSGAWAFRIEDSKSSVGIFAVQLSVGLLTQDTGCLVGNYSIHIPLFPSKDDHGRITIPIDKQLSLIGESGGTLTGEARSNRAPGEIHKIVCKITPLHKGRIELAITTTQRTIEFKSFYEVIADSGS